MAVMVFALVCGMAQAAAVVNFEDIAVPSGTFTAGGDRTSGGFFFDLLADLSYLANDYGLAANGTTYLVFSDYLGTNPLTMSQVTGGTFSLFSVDFGEPDMPNVDARTVDVTGNLLGGGTVNKTVTMDWIFDGTDPLVDFQTELFGWNNLTSVVFKGYGSDNGYNFLAIDNLELQPAQVIPEPATLTLVGFGLAALGLRIRRKRR